jgi:hypothetical protein
MRHCKGSSKHTHYRQELIKRHEIQTLRFIHSILIIQKLQFQEKQVI